MTIYEEESFYVHPETSVSIFSEISNSGSFGSYQNSIIHFFGRRWNNMAGSRMPAGSSNGMKGTGGNFKFDGIASAQSNTAYGQIINNQSDEPDSGFPNITIACSGNVMLEGSDLVIRNVLNFEKGHLLLNNRNARMLENSIITGYNENNYLVTGTGTSGGFLIRSTSRIQQQDLVFPIGTSINSYTPASLTYKGNVPEVGVRVFDKVYDKAVSGMSDNIYSVTKTWNVTLNSSDPKAELAINLQHNLNEEGSKFADNRYTSFISRFRTDVSEWDMASSNGLSPAILTSGNAIQNAFVNSRANISGLSKSEFFSKTTLKLNIPTASSLRIPIGISPNNDGLNDKFVIENLRPTDKVKIDIYNRWQGLVFRDTNYKNSFEGISNQNALMSNNLPDGTYYYIINVNNGKAMTGYIIINR